MDKILDWVYENCEKPWFWLSAIAISSILVNTGWPILAGLGLLLWGSVTYIAGARAATDYVAKKANKEKEKTNDAT